MKYSADVEYREADLVAIFRAAHDQAFFNQTTIAAVLCCSEAKMERDRWGGTAIRYHKIGRRCLYRKVDVVKWIEEHSVRPDAQSLAVPHLVS